MLFSKKEELSLVVYIGTNRISSSFVVFPKDKNPQIITSIRLPFPVSEKVDSASLTKNMFSLLEDSIVGLIKKGSTVPRIKNNNNIRSVILTIASPWYISRIKNLSLEQDKDFYITESFIHNVLEVEEKKFEEELSGGDYENNFGEKLSVMENTFTSSKVNGYKIKDILLKETKKLDLSLYSSVISEKILNKITSIIHKHTHISAKDIKFNTFPLLFFHNLREIDNSVNNFLLLDITGDISDLTLVSDGGIVQNISFPSARNFVLRQIAKKFGVSVEIAESMLHMFNLKKSDSSISQGLVEVFENIKKEWLIYFDDALLELSKNVTLPNNIYILSDLDVYPLYESFISDKKQFNIICINRELFSFYCDWDKNSLYDEYIASSVIFHNKK